MIGNFTKRVDKYRVYYRCHQTPSGEVLAGFQEGEVYEGRHFNGLYEVSASWGRETPVLISKKLFSKHFGLVKKRIKDSHT